MDFVVFVHLFLAKGETVAHVDFISHSSSHDLSHNLFVHERDVESLALLACKYLSHLSNVELRLQFSRTKVGPSF